MTAHIEVTTNEQGAQVVSARALHTFLDASERFANWFDRQLQYGFVENQDYVGCKVFNTLANQELTDYVLTLDCAKEVAMIQRTEKGKQARQYFIECERRLAEQNKFTSPVAQLSRKELALMVIQVEEEKERLQEQLKLQAPKVEYANEVLDTTDCVVTTVIANEMGYSAVKFNLLLKQMGIQWKVDGIWVLTSRYLQKGYAQMRTHTFADPTTKLMRATQLMVWTQRGRAFLWWELKKQEAPILQLQNHV